MVYVSVHAGESLDSAMKRFNQKVQHSGLLRDLKDHAHYEKPSERRRRQSRRRVSSRG
ncbi:MAG: 30S ribosomal protein S21 [Fimbriimonadaceae bacterium]|nr:30S ribosomal protein S21 [Fimbriimonadaceae bacterium]